MSKEGLFDVLRGLLRHVVDARFEGGAGTKLARMQGYSDGYMQAMLDAGFASQAELLSTVREARGSLLREQSDTGSWRETVANKSFEAA